MTTITYPLYLHGRLLGRLRYPKRKGRIQIFLMDIGIACHRDDISLVQEINLTLIEEMTHEYDGRRVNPNHYYEDILHNLPCGDEQDITQPLNMAVT